MSLLDADADYLTLVNTFTVEPEKADQLLAALSTATKTAFIGKPGFISANLHISLDGKHVANYAQWRSKDNMAAAMQDPAVQAGIREASSLAIGFAPVLYRLADTHTAEAAA